MPTVMYHVNRLPDTNSGVLVRNINPYGGKLLQYINTGPYDAYIKVEGDADVQDRVENFLLVNHVKVLNKSTSQVAQAPNQFIKEPKFVPKQKPPSIFSTRQSYEAAHPKKSPPAITTKKESTQKPVNPYMKQLTKTEHPGRPYYVVVQLRSLDPRGAQNKVEKALKTTNLDIVEGAKVVEVSEMRK